MTVQVVRSGFFPEIAENQYVLSTLLCLLHLLTCRPSIHQCMQFYVLVSCTRISLLICYNSAGVDICCCSAHGPVLPAGGWRGAEAKQEAGYGADYGQE